MMKVRVQKIFFTTFLLIAASRHIGLEQHIDTTKIDAYDDTLETNNKFTGSIAGTFHLQKNKNR